MRPWSLPRTNRLRFALHGGQRLCLALGFEGRYKLIEGGRDKLAGIREWLYNLLQKERGNIDPALSPHWQGVTDQRHPLMRLMPLWVFGAVAMALLAMIYSGFLFSLNRASDPVFGELFKVRIPTIAVPEPEPLPEPEPVPEPQITLSMMLADEIARQQVKVVELVQRSTVTIQGDNLFASGSASVNPAIIPLLHRIAEALNALPGQVVIVGHSDNVPIRSVRYPSNWALSKARAEAVAEIVRQNLSDPDRISVEGKADLEPVASNATRKGRARNRRVEIILLK